ncbi:MAG: hypothetical protein PVJ38_01320 [Candidatus Bathyarchaeota archaeon]
MTESLSDVERTVYELISRAGEIMAKDIPSKMAGAVPSLKNKGLVEVYKKPASLVSRKKQTFIRVIDPEG